MRKRDREKDVQSHIMINRKATGRESAREAETKTDTNNSPDVKGRGCRENDPGSRYVKGTRRSRAFC